MAGLQFLKRDLTSMKVAKDLGRELPPGDLTIFTTGIVPKNTREVNGDGIELDMAVSCLSRLVILRELAPRLPQGSRVFVYGMPGNGESASRLDDLNSEKAYEVFHLDVMIEQIKHLLLIMTLCRFSLS